MRGITATADEADGRPSDLAALLPLTDHALLDRIGLGDGDAFRRFHAQHAQRVYLVAFRVLGDRQLAEEVAQDTFVSLWNGRCSYDALRGAPLPWLLTVTRHRAIDRWRSERRRPQCVADSDQQLAMMAAPGDVEKALVDRELCLDIRTQLQSLPVSQKAAIALSYYGELTQAEVATRLDVPLGTVKSRIRLGLTRLRATS